MISSTNRPLRARNGPIGSEESALHTDYQSVSGEKHQKYQESGNRPAVIITGGNHHRRQPSPAATITGSDHHWQQPSPMAIIGGVQASSTMVNLKGSIEIVCRWDDCTLLPLVPH